MEPSLALLFEFYERVHRKGPGSRATTRRAFSRLGDLPPKPKTVDFGCGSGASALVLAELGADVTGVEIHGPFLDDLRQRAAASGVADRVSAVEADMADPGLKERDFDLVWSEGAIYLIGFAEGLMRWRRWLRPGGKLAVSEVTWLKESRPDEVQSFWDEGYPAIATIEANLAALAEAGYRPIGHFVLPPSDWEAYFVPMEDALTRFGEERAGDDQVAEFCDAQRREIDLCRRHGDCFGYVFYLAEVAD